MPSQSSVRASANLTARSPKTLAKLLAKEKNMKIHNVSLVLLLLLINAQTALAHPGLAPHRHPHVTGGLWAISLVVAAVFGIFLVRNKERL